MGISGPVSLAVALAGIAVVLIVAFRTHLVDRLAHRLDPPQRHQPRARQCSHLKVVRNGPPSPLSHRCDLEDWDGPRGGAA